MKSNDKFKKTKPSRLFGFIFGLPISLKISLIMIFTLSTSIILITNILFNKEKELLLNEIKNRGKLLSENLAQAGFEVIINKDKLFSSDVINKMIKGEGIVYAIIVNKAGRIVDSSLSPNDPIKYIHKDYLNKYKKRIYQIKDTGLFSVVFKGKNVIDIVRLVILEYKGKKNKLGFVRVGISQDIINDEIKKAWIHSIIIAGLFIIIGIIISFLLSRSITTPIRKIVYIMNKVSEGDLSQNVDVKQTDEIGKLSDSFNMMITQLREKFKMSKYISKSTIKMISESEGDTLQLGGIRKSVAILFSDIRGFTAFSETRAPEQIITVLNKYLSVQAEIITANNGSVDKFVGDEVVAVFEGPNNVTNAIASAIKIQKMIGILCKRDGDNISIGIGINTGVVVMGNMGSKNRMDYTVIGDNVNVASRLCAFAKKGQIIISAATYRVVKGKFNFARPFALSVKGKKEPIKVLEIVY